MAAEAGHEVVATTTIFAQGVVECLVRPGIPSSIIRKLEPKAVARSPVQRTLRSNRSKTVKSFVPKVLESPKHSMCFIV